MSVPSSTSNSSERLPKGPVRSVWIAALTSFVLFLGTFEVVARAYGYGPTVRDSMGLWCVERDRASKAGKNSIVLLGASRMQLDMVPEELSKHFPEKEVAMLAVKGKCPVAMLEGLARDEEFTGTVICSVTMRSLLPAFWDDQTPYIDHYDQEWSRRIGLAVIAGAFIESHLALLHEGLSYPALDFRLRGNAYRNYRVTRTNRYIEAHHEKLGGYIHQFKRNTRSSYESIYASLDIGKSPEDMDAHYSRVENSVRRLMNRGCRVVFVRLPSSGRVWELDRQFFPKQFYWDRFAGQTTAQAFHFRDYESLSGFECPEDSHLDYSDAIRFTHAFAELLLEDGDAMESNPPGTSPD